MKKDFISSNSCLQVPQDFRCFSISEFATSDKEFSRYSEN
ncbi:hypothetical protein PHEL85_1827 [Polaribacter sp. Hel1_85]|nr:hypothetical protein PHEL85_1827 [Polaribacter sp. Hel1_85]